MELVRFTACMAGVAATKWMSCMRTHHTQGQSGSDVTLQGKEGDKQWKEDVWRDACGVLKEDIIRLHMQQHVVHAWRRSPSGLEVAA
jgi:hypothetical protein